jgi:pyridoxine/pyridoxamine 5'-phosphate oxidase
MSACLSAARSYSSVQWCLPAGYDERGFVFYTNYSSRKGQELAAGGRTALAFWWEGLQRQVRLGHLAAAWPGVTSAVRGLCYSP